MENKETNKDEKGGCGCLILILIIVIGAGWFGAHKYNQYKEHKVAVAKQEQEKKEEAAYEKAQEEAKKAQDNLPKINFDGIIKPNLATTGEKVVITVNVENTSDKIIHGIKLVFSNKKLLEKGLVITNIMNGGVRNGRDVFWQMDIPAHDKRSFNIVGQANEPGEYSTAITFGEYDGYMYYKSKNDNDELDGKLVVMPN